jgi:signal transduction histidine kinase
VFDSLDPAGAAFVRDKLGRAFAGEMVSFEVPFTRLDGSGGTSWVSYAPVREGGEIRKVMALARDVTEQRRTEAQLQRAERLASLGQLVSGVAHEINNPAAIISGVAQTLLLEPLSAGSRRRRRCTTRPSASASPQSPHVRRALTAHRRGSTTRCGGR